VKVSDVGSPDVVTRENFGEAFVEGQLPLLDRVMDVDLEGHVLVISAISVNPVSCGLQ